MLALHSVAMNGGVLHALGCFEPQGLEAAASGYRFFGLDGVADLLNEAKSVSKAGDDLDLWEAELDKRYSALVPNDAALVERFEFALRHNPLEFAPF